MNAANVSLRRCRRCTLPMVANHYSDTAGAITCRPCGRRRRTLPKEAITCSSRSPFPLVVFACCRFEPIPWSQVEKRLPKRRDKAICDSQTYRQDPWRPRNKVGCTGEEGFNYRRRGGSVRGPNCTHAKDIELSCFRRKCG